MRTSDVGVSERGTKCCVSSDACHHNLRFAHSNDRGEDATFVSRDAPPAGVTSRSLPLEESADPVLQYRLNVLYVDARWLRN